MNEVYAELAMRIRSEASDLDRVIQRALAAWQKAQRAPDSDAYLDSVALNLHGFYSGLERLFELVVRHVDGNMPTGEMWHRYLLHQVSQDIADVRPAVISPNSGRALDEFRRFRHLVRNVYTMNLIPERMAGLMAQLPELWTSVRAELVAFADFLTFLAQAD